MTDENPIATGPKPLSGRAGRRARREQGQAEGRCTAKSKGTGKRCAQRPVEGRGVCRFHGGHAGRPVIHGRYAEALPGRLRAAVAASLADDSLFDHAQTAALMDGLVKEAALLVADLDSPDFRKRAVDMVESIEALMTMGKDPALAVHALAQHLRRGASEIAAQDRLSRMTERLDARLCEANRLKLAKQNAISSVDLVGVMQGMLGAIQRLAPPDLAKSIADELEKILGGIDIAPPARETIVGRG